MNDELIAKAVECGIEKLDEANRLLKKVLRRIANTFGSNAKGKTERELLDDVLETMMYYGDVFTEVKNDT